MKKIIIITMAFLMFLLCSCSSSVKEETAEPVTDNNSEEQPSENNKEEGKTLVVVFSATGNTLEVAKKIVSITGADLYEIKAKEEYSSDDLNWHDNNSRTTIEQNDKSVRPEIGSEAVDLDGYTTVYVGYPIWWGEEPRIMDTFVESYDFTGMKMIPFCTSSSSGMGRSGKNLAELAGSGNWLDGKRFSEHAAEEEVRNWIEGLK